MSNAALPKLCLALAGASALALCAAAGAAPQGPPPAPAPAAEPRRTFREARPINAAEAFEFEMGGFSYVVKRNGNGRRTKGPVTRGFNLRLDGDVGLERVSFSEYGGDLLLVCEVGDGETGAGLVTLLGQPSMRAHWKRSFPAFNVGVPLREGGHLYVTGNGFVARLDLATGEFDWKHEGLGGGRGGTADAFTSFAVPELAGDTVLFRGAPVYNPRRTLVVKKKTGEVVRVE